MQLFEQTKTSIPSTFKDRFGWSPFSVLDTTSSEWIHRKSTWDKLIINSTDGRTAGSSDVSGSKRATPINIHSAHSDSDLQPQGVSEFDPLLCELMYRWFSRPGDVIIDPFAGGCTRGLVAAVLGRDYQGIDLSSLQVQTNFDKYSALMDKYSDISGKAFWYSGDSEILLNNMRPEYNMLFTCPPYYNLEKYTDNPADLSNLPTYSDFLAKYSNILSKAVGALADNSFVVVVVSEVRRSGGISNSEYLGLVPDTIHILRDICNLHYYNEAILQTSIGSLPIRTSKYFNQSRKLGRRHQNILIFYKGCIGAIEHEFGTLG